jgi:transposase
LILSAIFLALLLAATIYFMPSSNPAREAVRRTDTDPGFKVIPRRWVVERSIGWLTRYRRLVRDYEQRLDVSEAMIFLAMGNLLLRRITHP